MLEFAESIFIALLKSPQKHAPLNAIGYLNIKYMLMYLFQNWRKIHIPSFEEKKPLQSQGLPEYLEKWCVACHLCLHKAPLRIAFIWDVSQNLALDSQNIVKSPFCQHCPLWAVFWSFSHLQTQKENRLKTREYEGQISHPTVKTVLVILSQIQGYTAQEVWAKWALVKWGQIKVTAKALLCPVEHPPTFLQRSEV